ncbi:MAG TPA: response regulator [Candidatus Binatia bacterium]|jgi:CheY-like chemotaxis protein
MVTAANGRPVEILLVEDNPGDVRLTKEALKEGNLLNRLSVVGDGMEALAFLRREGKFAGSARPDMILLDLNLPKKSGLEVLADVKADEDLRRTPVVVLTTSQAEQDIIKSYNLYANCYISKPVDLGEFMNVVKSIEEFWLTVVKLPCDGDWVWTASRPKPVG